MVVSSLLVIFLLLVKVTLYTLSGADLDVCQTEEEQCCTQGFLDGLRQGLGGDLLNGLREEVTNRVGDVQGIMDQFSTCE